MNEEVKMMRLTMYTDYSLRVLLYLALLPEGKKATIQEIATNYQISKNHLMKVIHQLGKLGYIKTIRGHGGGIVLNQRPEALVIGEIVRKTEDDFYCVECFNQKDNRCIITPSCKLRNIMYEATQSFLAVLDQYTIADLLTTADDLKQLLNLK